MCVWRETEAHGPTLLGPTPTWTSLPLGDPQGWGAGLQGANLQLLALPASGSLRCPAPLLAPSPQPRWGPSSFSISGSVCKSPGDRSRGLPAGVRGLVRLHLGGTRGASGEGSGGPRAARCWGGAALDPRYLQPW